MAKKDDLLMNKASAIAILIVLPLSVLFFILTTPSLTGFSINSGVKVASGSVLAVVVIFFIFLLFLIKVRPKHF